MTENSLQLVRLRLAGNSPLVYFLRDTGRSVAGEEFPGANPFSLIEGRIASSHSPTKIVREYSSCDVENISCLTLDVHRCKRSLMRQHSQWSKVVRGTIVDFDNVLWDAAASVHDLAERDQLRDSSVFHDLYSYVWGDLQKPPPQVQRITAWQEQITWLEKNLHII